MTSILNFFRRATIQDAAEEARDAEPQDWITVFVVAEEDLNHLLKPAVGLNLTQSRFLFETACERDGNQLGSIASRLMLAPNTASAVTKSLQSLNYIDVYRTQNNLRVRRVTLTDGGKRVLQKIGATYGEYYRRLKKTLTKEQLHDLCMVTACSARREGADYAEDDSAAGKTATIAAGSACALGRLASVAKKHGYTLTQIRVLAAIAAFETPQRIGTLAARLGLLPNVTSINLKPLEKDDLIERIPDGLDKRAVRIALTDEGSALSRVLIEEYAPHITIPERYLLAAPRPLTAHLFPVKHPE